MKHCPLKHAVRLSTLLLLSVAPLLASETSTEEIDRTVWGVVASTVAAHDIEGMAKTYHPDAVLVSSNGTVAIAEQLSKWGKGMADMRASGASANVSFRFNTRQDGEHTAFETGIFKYTQIDGAGAESPRLHSL